MVNRIALVLGKDYTRKFCLWDHMPKKRTYENYGKDAVTFDLVGRVHLDYMQLYRKYTYHEMHSYSLDAIAEHELGDRKVAYEGTLDQLYNNDFEQFITYNIQDTVLLRKLDDKLQFIDLANVLAHSNGVLLQNTMGAVAQTDQAIINEAHSRGLIVPDKARGGSEFAAAGAYVADPVRGLHEWIGSIDLNSLYPSILRSCNMSPECIVGQIRHTITTPGIEAVLATGKKSDTVAKYWEGKFACHEYELVMNKDRNTTLYVDMEDGKSYEASGAEIYDLIFEQGQPWALTANGTIFTFERKGVIPGLLERWYAERKELQAKAREFKGDPDKKAEFAFWDKRQLVKKINLNSLYGALLNPHSRFYDHRLGQSTTLTGRCIARHMAAETNRVIAGEYDHMGKSIIYGDSVTGDSMIRTSEGHMPIEELFDKIQYKVLTDQDEDGNYKEYAIPTDAEPYGIQVMGYSAFEDNATPNNISYVMRHKTKKQLYEIETEDGRVVTVTEDHSIIVDRDGFTEEIKPADLLEDDMLITIDWPSNN
jgi:DNA polymerase elongation subunit (family B)